jgi:hypothetical protein
MASFREYLDPIKLLNALDRFEAWMARKPKWLRITAGVLLCIGGFLWFLPIVGLWMLPLGLMVLSQDIPWLYDRREHFEAWLRKAARAHTKKD